jgi:hypothetical protein
MYWLVISAKIFPFFATQTTLSISSLALTVPASSNQMILPKIISNVPDCKMLCIPSQINDNISAFKSYIFSTRGANAKM